MKKDHKQAYSCAKEVQASVNSSKACRDVCVDCRAGCSTKNALKCHHCFDKANVMIQECITACTNAIRACNKHESECGNQECNQMIEKMLAQYNKVINACQMCTKSCHHDPDSKPCLDAWRSCIKQCDILVTLGEQFLAKK